jgi:hypothetical protein
MNRIHYCAVFAIALLSGCAGFSKDWKAKLPWSPLARLKTSKYETPTHMIAIWSPDILTQPGQPPTRGFGGRIYFYNDKNQAVPVEGQLVVYGYDDTHNPDQPGQPQRKFAFTPDQFTKHYSNSDLGASYSIWLPWDAVGGEQSSVSLVPVFTATSGQMVMGEQAANVLPGREEPRQPPARPTSLLTARKNSEVQQVTHQQIPAASSIDGVNQNEPSQRMRTSTINLTPSLQRRLAHNEVVQSPGGRATAELPNQNVRNPAAVPTITEAAPNQLPMNSAQAEARLAEPSSDPQRAHFGRQKFPVRAMPGGRSTLPAPWTPPYPATPPSALPPASIP